MLKIHVVEPLKKAYQLEYSLYRQLSEMFANVCCRSMAVDRLYLYYREGPAAHAEDNADSFEKASDLSISRLIQKDVIGHIEFPLMSACQAEVYVRTLGNGLHEFIFTDGIYSFSVSLCMDRRYKKALGINVSSDHSCS